VSADEELTVPMLLAANDGGHLMELFALRERLPAGEPAVWITTKTPQSESLLRGEEVFWVPASETRDWRAVVKNASAVRDFVWGRGLTAAVTTGSSLALSVLPLAAARGLDCCYIESATRTAGPSLSGRLLAQIPQIRCFTQYAGLETRRWKYAGSVFDGYRAVDNPEPAASSPLKVVVSLGTSRTYGFRRAVENVASILPADSELLWQTGATNVDGLAIEGRQSVPEEELSQAIRRADVVISHAGAGIALTALRQGKWPILLPRAPAFREHVDDHQQQLAMELARRGLALVRDPDELSAADLQLAQTKRIEPAPLASPLALNMGRNPFSPARRGGRAR
jgi:UDP-N-acetylglucosamine transferase subunit ALG13